MPFGDFFDKLMQEVGLSDPPPPPPQGPVYGPQMPAPASQLDQLMTIIAQGTGRGPTVPPLTPTPMPPLPAYAPYNADTLISIAASKPITQPTPDLIRHWQQQQQQALLAQQQQRGGGGPFAGLTGALGDAYNAVNSGIDRGAGAAMSVPGAIWDAETGAIGNALDNPISAAFNAIGVLDRPRQEVVEDMGNQAYYQATHNGDKPNHGLSANPYVLLGNVLPDSFLIRFANDPANWEAIKKAYEEGYDSNGDGAPDFTGGRAVWELYAGTIGRGTRTMADLAFDPLSAAAGVGKAAGGVGKAAEVAGKADDASRTARVTGAVVGPLGKGTETVLHAIDAAPGKVLIDAPKGLVKGAAGATNVLTGGVAGDLGNQIARPFKYLAAPSAKTAANHANQELDDALGAVAKSDGSLWTSVAQTPPTVSGGAVDTAVRDANGIVPNGVFDPAFPPPPIPEPHPYGLDQATVDQLGYLAPKVGGDRMVDQVFAGLAGQDPSAQSAFLDRYLPLAQKHISDMDAIELARSRAARAGKNVDRFAIDKPLASARHVAEDLQPIARDVLGTDAPGYRFMNPDLGDTFNVLRDETGKVLLSKEELNKLAPDVRRLIEDAVFGPDQQLATDARYFLRQTGNKRLNKVADELKRLRAMVHGPEAGAVDTAAGDALGVATKDNPLGDLANVVDAAPPVNPVNDVPPVTASPPLMSGKPAGAAKVGAAIPITEDTAGNALQRAVDIGEIDQESADLLSQTVRFDKNGKVYRGSIVNPDEKLKTALDPKTGVMTDPIPAPDLSEKRVIDVYTEMLATGKTPAEAKQATYDLLKQSVPRVGQDGSRLFRAFGKALSAYDGMTAAVREHLMYNVFTGPRGIVTDQVGDALQLTSQGDIAVAARTFNPREWVKQWTVVRHPGEAAAASLADTSTGRMLDRVGMAAPSEFMPNVGREEVGRSGAMSIPRFVERITGSETAGKVTGYATAPLASRNIRDFRTALESTRRLTTYGDAFSTGLADARTGFFDQVRQLGDTRGVDVSGMLDDLGEEFSPKDVRLFGAQAGLADGDALQLAKSWRSSLKTIDREAMATTKQKLFSYESTRADEVLKRTILFHYWMTRATPRYLETMVRNPEIAVNFYRATNGLQKAAEGKPRSVQGLIQMMSGPAGYLFLANPTALVGTALMFRDQAVDDGQDRLFDRFLKNSGGFLNPLLETALVAAGWVNDDAVDPFASYSTRNTLKAIAQYGVSQGWLGDQRLVEDPYDNARRRILGATSQWAADHNVPFAQGLNPGQQNATAQSMVSNDIIRLVQQQFGLDPGMALADWPVEAQQALNDAQGALLTGTGGNPITDEAIQNYSAANLQGRLMGLGVPGGVRIRSDVRDQRMVAAAGPDGDPVQRTFRDQGNAGSPLAAQLNIGEANVQNVGADAPQIGVASPTDQVGQGKLLAQQYNAIRYGTATQIAVGGTIYSTAQLAQMSDDQRKGLADQWLMEQGGNADRQAYYDARDAVLAQPINQPYSQYLDAAGTMRDIGPDTLARQSPAYAAYLDQNPNQPFSPSAYLATQGERGSVYDPMTLPDTFDPTQADPLAQNAAAAATQAPQQQTREQRLAAQMSRYQGDVALFNQTLQQYTGNPNASIEGMNPMLRNSVLNNLAQVGVSAPSMPNDLAMYTRWVGLQPKGADTSIQAYYRWVDSVTGGTAP